MVFNENVVSLVSIDNLQSKRIASLNDYYLIFKLRLDAALYPAFAGPYSGADRSAK